MAQYEILHVVPHLGGGVGTVVRGYLDYAVEDTSFRHTLVSLDDLNDESKRTLTSLGCEWSERMYWDVDSLDTLIARADVVLVHWWNHPLLQALLMNHAFPASRVIFWTHVSGTPSPNNFCKFIIDYPDRLIFTTPLSFYAPEIQDMVEERRKNIGWIWSTAGVERLATYNKPAPISVKEKKNIIGYVGNLDYTKLNNQFLQSCQDMNDLDAEFVVIGPLTQKFKADYDRISSGIKVHVTGYVPEIEKFQKMRNFSIFGYPLARHHYATCDQAIQEAMALGAVPVVLNNPMESYMVEHERTGLIARNMNEYSAYVRRLVLDEDLRNTLAMNAQRYAENEYSIKKMADKWAHTYRDVLLAQKVSRPSLSQIRGRFLAPNEIFTESLGSHAGVFLAHKEAQTVDEKRRVIAQVSCLQAHQNWSSPTKSTASHYYSYFKDDEWLKKWSTLTLASDA